MAPIDDPRDDVQGPRLPRELQELERLWRHGEQVLGERGWFLLRCFGKMTAGPYSGKYVSALPPRDVHALLHMLATHARVPVHLMHRHQPGDRPGLYTRLGTDGRLIMGFDDAEADA